jgi:predicted dehydrogenase
LEVFGTDGYARILPARLLVGRDGRLQDVAGELSDLSTQHPDDDPAVYALQIDDFLDSILQDRAPACDGRAGLTSVTVVEAAYRSARHGAAVTVEAIPDSDTSNPRHDSIERQAT